LDHPADAVGIGGMFDVFPAARGCLRTVGAERLANRAKDWAAFDLSVEEPKGAMWLSARGCYREAADAGRDYLAHGRPPQTLRAQTSISFYIARNLAGAGDRSGAVLAASASPRFDQPAGATFDWNSYVEGFAAYLSRDIATTRAMHARLIANPSEPNRINAAVLARTLRCFGQPFRVVKTSIRCDAPVNVRN
jgi:hypothetical protein